MSKLKKYSLILMAIVMVAVSALTVYAEEPTTGSLTIILHEQRNGDTTTNPLMEGITYTLYKVEDDCEYLWEAASYVANNPVIGIEKISGADGKIIYTDLELGRYYAELTKVPDGTVGSPEGFLVDIPVTNVNGTGFVYDIVVEPKISTAFGNLELTKVNSEGTPISGVTFKVQVKAIPMPGGLDDALSDEWTDYIPEGETTPLTVVTDSNGKITLSNLPQTSNRVEYRLLEVSAPNGYIINNDALSNIKFFVTYTGKITVNANSLSNIQSSLFEVEEGDNLTKIKYTNEKPEITKKVKNSVGTFVDSAGINATDTVTFKVTADVPLQLADMRTYKISDVLPAGLTLDRNSIKVEGTIASGTEELDSNLCTLSNNGLELIFDTSKMVDMSGNPLYSAIILTYDAIVDIDNIIIGGNGNINTASLIYTNNVGESYYDKENDEWVYCPEISTHTIIDTAEVHTGALKIEKVEKGNTTNKLAGAKFKIATTQANAEAGTFVKDANGNDIEVETNANGLAEIKGLAYADDGSDTSYWLVETKAPTYKETVDEQPVTKLYNLLQNPVEVQIGKTTYDTAVTIQNSKGLDLPATGGIGIAIFAVVGITLMVISKKMSKEEVK